MPSVRPATVILTTLFFLECCSVFGQNYTISTVAGGGLPVDLPGLSASLSYPQILASDATGNLYFVYDDIVIRYDAASTRLTRFAGTDVTGFFGDNGPATSAQLNNPAGLAVDASGNVYIADQGNCRVREVSAGIISTVAGNGVCSPSGDGGSARLAGVNPVGLAFDSSGDLFISEGFSNTVREVSNGRIKTVAGTGKPGYTGEGGPATLAALNNPQAIAVGSSGDLYIADFGNNRVRKVSGGMITTVAGNGSPGGDTSDSEPALSAQLIPAGLAVDNAGILFISDPGSSKVRAVSGGTISTLAGTGSPRYNGDSIPATSANLNSPVGLALDASANVYIADSYNQRIRKVSNNLFTGIFITTVVGDGTASFSGDFGPAASAQLGFVSSVALDAAGTLYVADTYNNRVRKISGGLITTVAGTGTAGYSGDRGLAAQAELNQPLAVAVDPVGNLFVLDGGNGVVREISNGVITTVAGNNHATQPGDGASATNAQLSFPQSIAVDSQGNLYISEADRLLREVTGGIINTVNAGGAASASQLGFDSNLAVDSADSLYISSSKYNQVWTLTGGATSLVAGSGTLGHGGDGGPASSAQLGYPAGVAIDSSGNVYIADSNGGGVRKIANGIISTIAGFGGQGFSGDGGPALQTRLNGAASSIAVDAAGNVYIPDGHRIRVLTPAACTFQLSKTSYSAPPSGGSVQVDITTQAGCDWTITGLPNWISVQGVNPSSGSASLELVIAPNAAGSVLSANFTIAGLPFKVTEAVTQANYRCSNTAAPAITSVQSAGSFGAYPYFASGSWLEISGTNLADPLDPRLSNAVNPGQWTAADFSNGVAPVKLDGISVSIGGKPAYVWYLSPTQLNVQAPEDSGGGSVDIKVTNCNSTSMPFSMTRVAAAGGFLSAPGFNLGSKHYMTANFVSDGAFVLSSGVAAPLGVTARPAKPGDLIIAYGIGFGDVTPAIAPGIIVEQSNTLDVPITVKFGSTPASILYQGLAGNFVGLYEFYIQVPPGLTDGDYQINVTQNGAPIPQTLYLTVQN